MSLLDDLNSHQREAVLTTEGPVLVLAGAGTGKTRVITYRVAYLMEQGAPADAILAVTFTNKAANEMKQRVAGLLRPSGHNAAALWISTFHSFCARLLRREGSRLALPRGFAIYDGDDQTRAIKLATQHLGVEDRKLPPHSLREQISYAKNLGISAAGMAAEAFDELGRTTAAIFEEYERILRGAGALDFDDLLLRAVQLLREQADSRIQWSARFRYILVDEFQDTNAAQEELIRLLGGRWRSVCVVGDEDQSIYSWRGAQAENLRRFTEDFPDARIIRLEENYRSTQTILAAAGAVVAHNRRRLGRTLRAILGGGTSLRFFEARDAAAEAEFVGGEISRLVRNEPGVRAAVLYRTTAQSRSFEEALRRLGIRYRVVGGFGFFQRAEVKDALSYVRLVFHPDDDVALLRVLNTPPRGIGPTTMNSLRARARQTGTSIWKAIAETLESGESRKSTTALKTFRELLERLVHDCQELGPAELIRRVLDRTGYLDWIEQLDILERSSKAENLRELANAMAEGAEEGQTLADILDRAALVSDVDEYDADVPISLMTLHSAKGLEFDHVFLAGLEEGLLPHSRSLERDADVEEERRLCYVGMTRAKLSLTLSRAIYRRNYDSTQLRAAAPSRFLAEIPGELIEVAAASLAEPGETRRYEPDLESSEPRADRRHRRSAARGQGQGSPPRSSLIGIRVRHPAYGVGTILAVEGDGEDRRLTVSFLDYGTKKLIERYAHLEMI